MKKIFACNQFATEEDKEFSLVGITSEKYLETMLSCIENSELYIAEKEEKVSIELAVEFSEASYIKMYTVDVCKIDVINIIVKEKALSNICKDIAAKGEKEKTVLAEVKKSAERIAGGEGICMTNVVNRAQRVEKLYELGAPDLVVNNERLYLLEYLSLNEIATKCNIIKREDFPQVFGS